VGVATCVHAHLFAVRTCQHAEFRCAHQFLAGTHSRGPLALGKTTGFKGGLIMVVLVEK
jgi:hypothetical protein